MDVQLTSLALSMSAAVITTKFSVLLNLLGGKHLGHGNVIAQVRGSKIALC